ncbi:MAG TPA: putative Ig domain-containing protein, partial [Acidimicrobiales bacterium]|nr:putative Ig domain-containing protein [Acidimicrobiales bacterium]
MNVAPGVPRRRPAGSAVPALLLLPIVLVGYPSPLAGGHAAKASNAYLQPSTVPTGSDWLGEINLYRKAAGLQPVTNEAAWDAAIDAHLRYMEKTPSSYFTGQYASAHTENPASPYYSAAGAHEAESSDLAFGDAGGTDVQTIDAWLECPFHAIGMLRPALTRVAYASVGDDAGLDVLSGLDEQSSAAPQVLFPGPGMTTDLTSYCGDESPSPLQTCGWPDQDEGLPLIALLTAPPSGQLAASLNGPGAEMTGQNGGLCIVDTGTFKTTDSIYGPNGANILATDNAVILVPRHTLSRGTYQARVTQPGRPDIAWSFTVIPPPSVVTSGLFPAVTGHSYSGHLSVVGGEAPYSWSLGSGRLPRGLALAPDGSITGVPSGPASTTPLTFKVTDERGLTALSAPVDFTVATSAGASPIELSVIVGKQVKQQLQANGGTSPDTWSVTSGQFPPGLSLNHSGLLTGTPTSLATETVSARVTDATGQSTVQVVDIWAVTVNHKPVAYAYVAAASRSCSAPNTIYGELQDDILGPFTVGLDFTIGSGPALI